MHADDHGQLRTGDEYRRGLRDDGRRVWLGGEQISDVTVSPTLGAGISLLAGMLDDQFAPEVTDTLTYIDPGTGARRSRAWQAPATTDDLLARRRLMEFTSRRTVGTFGRCLDLGPTIAVGLYARRSRFRKSRPAFLEQPIDFAENIERYIDHGQRLGIIAAEVLTEPQTDRSKPSGAGAALLRVVAQEKHGIRISGAKSVGSLSAQADEIIFTNLKRPDYPPEACVWAATPVAAEGITLVCREGVSKPDSDAFDHPIASLGEESDQLIIFDNVFVPNERVFALGDPELIGLYGPVTVWAHWQILTRLAVKAEIMVGAAQLAVDMLGTGGAQGVRTMVGQIMQYAQVLRSFVLSAENEAAFTEDGVLAPDANLLTAGRLYGVEHYPAVIHTLQEVCGQGLVMRFTRADFDHPEIGAHLERLLPGHDVTAREKNRLMNFIWDLTTDSHAGRSALFENVNGGTAPALRERLYFEYERERAVGMARDAAGMA